MKKPLYLLGSIFIGVIFFGIMFTIIRTFYYNSFPSFQEYVLPFAMGTAFGTGIGLWRIQTAAYRKKLEKTASELSIANTELKRKNKALVETQAKLRQSEKMEAMGIIAGGVAHDLNNILSGIIIYPDMMLQDIPKESALIEPLKKIKKSGEKAAAIIQDLLTLARRRLPHDEIVDIKATVQQYLLSPEYERLLFFHPNVVVETEFNDPLRPVKGASIHLHKIIMNLVSNAAEAMLDGGLIRISLESRYINYPVGNNKKTAEGDYTILSVSDTGPGIEKEDLERIFEPFFTKKKMGRSGTGLGMAVVWETVRDHNGYIEVNSQPGEGSRFTIYLPSTVELPELKNGTASSFEKHGGSGELVLIVDDVHEQRELAIEILQTIGYRAVSVPNGESAIEYFKNNSADVMLLDMLLAPGIDGVETYKGIVQYRPDIKVISMSGYSKPETIQELKNLGISEFLQKPYTIESISNALNRVLNG